MKVEYVEYLKITDSNSNCVELTLEEVRSLRDKLNRSSFDEIFITEEEDLNSDVPPEDVEKIREHMEARSYQFKIDWRGEKYQIPESITDAQLERFEKFLEREGALENYMRMPLEVYHVNKNLFKNIMLIVDWDYNNYWKYWNDLDDKWRQEIKGENNGENN